MKKLYAVFSIFLLIGLFAPLSMAFADIDTPDFQANVSPKYVVADKTYGHFETEIYDIPQAVNNMVITTEINKSADALVRSYARFKYTESGKWTSYMAFDGEYHFAAVETVSAYQLMFVVRDLSKGSTTIQSFAVQGVYVAPEKMEWALQTPVEFNPNKAYAKPAVVARKDWGARAPKSAYTEHAPQRIIVHHSYIPNLSQYKGAASIRGIQSYHMDDPKTLWSDIGYHFLIGPEGTIYQGRPETVVGAHCSPNTNSVGICLIGDYDANKDTLSAASKQSLLNLMSWIASNYKIDPKTNIFGHCDFSTKSCPGTTVYEKLPEYKEVVLKNIK